jgi:hypothetical protein
VSVAQNRDRLARVMIAVVIEKNDLAADFVLKTSSGENLGDQVSLGEKSARLLTETNNGLMHG